MSFSDRERAEGFLAWAVAVAVTDLAHISNRYFTRQK